MVTESLALVLLAVTAAAPVRADGDVVVPGTVVRWRADGTERCANGKRSWAPVGDTCFLPVDLLASGKLSFTRMRYGKSEAIQVRVGRYPYGEQRIQVPKRLVQLSRADLERVERERGQIAPLFWRESEARFSLPLASPLADAQPGGRFGVKRFFNGEPRGPHSGADFGAAAGTPVLAVDDGVVALVADHFFGGNSIFIDHGGGLITMYLHLSRADVGEKVAVRRGQVIGLVGATGRAVGPHLHFAIRFHGARVDPALLIGPPAALPEIGR